MDKDKEDAEGVGSYLKKACGVAYGFAKDKKGLEVFYNKQLRVKYKSKMRKTMLLLNVMIAAQEILLLVHAKQGRELSLFRIVLWIWLLSSMVFLLLSHKVYQISVLVVISTKTLIYMIELYSIEWLQSEDTERIDLAFFNFVFQSMLDSLIFISMGKQLLSAGIFPVGILSIMNAVSYLLILLNTLILKLRDEATPSLIAMITFFYFFNFVDLLNHFDTELLLFFNYIKIEKKGYYLNTFLDRLMPKHIKGVSVSTECYTDVTLLFADIVGFTEYSAGKKPRQVVEMLSQLFTAFDKECNKLNLYKLYTIGDCYVVMSFLDKNNRKKPAEEANDVVQLSMFMINSIAEVRKRINFPKLNMRIGIHTVRNVSSRELFTEV